MSDPLAREKGFFTKDFPSWVVNACKKAGDPFDEKQIRWVIGEADSYIITFNDAAALVQGQVSSSSIEWIEKEAGK